MHKKRVKGVMVTRSERPASDLEDCGVSAILSAARERGGLDERVLTVVSLRLEGQSGSGSRGRRGHSREVTHPSFMGGCVLWRSWLNLGDREGVEVRVEIWSGCACDR